MELTLTVRTVRSFENNRMKMYADLDTGEMYWATAPCWPDEPLVAEPRDWLNAAGIASFDSLDDDALITIKFPDEIDGLQLVWSDDPEWYPFPMLREPEA